MKFLIYLAKRVIVALVIAAVFYAVRQGGFRADASRPTFSPTGSAQVVFDRQRI